jgi:muramidase (phage lysozyme)
MGGNMNSNRRAFLAAIAVSEGTEHLGDHGYDCLVGGSLFQNYDDHPRKVVILSKKLSSTAAGRYQILSRIYDFYKKSLKLPDFSPDSQDKIALQLIKECKALNDIDAGRFDEAVTKCKSRWASLPGAGYGQHENKLEDLRLAYRQAGGEILIG